MKKTFKRLGAVLLAAFMLLSTTICALADDNMQATTPTTSKITLNVSNVNDGDTVSAYKLVWYNDKGNGYEFDTGFQSYIESQTDRDGKTAEQYLASLDATGVNKLLEGYAVACKTEKTYQLPTASASEKATSSNTASLKLEAGYYLLLTTTTGKNSYIYTPLSAFVKMDGDKLVVYAGYSKTELSQQEGAYTVSAKYAGGPTIDKKTNATKGAGKKQEWKGTAAAGVGETVRFYVKVNIPKYNDGTTLNLTVNDTLTDLQYKTDSVKVYADEPKLDANGVTGNPTPIDGAIKNTDIAGNYTVDNGTGTGTQKLKFELNYAAIMNGATAEKSVYVYYEATVQPEAVKNGKHEGTNVASLTYANASTSGSMHETDNVTTKVFDYYLKLNKVKDNTEEPLQGAKFSVYTEEEGGEPLKFVEVTENGTTYYRLAVAGDAEGSKVTQIEANFRIRGLDANTYYLEEVETPKGYTKPKGRFKIVMTSNFDNGKHTGKLDSDKSQSFMAAVNSADKDLIFAGSGADTSLMHQFSATIKNFSTPNLPTTGGTGTVLLSIGGVVLMAAGAYLLFFRKKKEN